MTVFLSAVCPYDAIRLWKEKGPARSTKAMNRSNLINYPIPHFGNRRLNKKTRLGALMLGFSEDQKSGVNAEALEETAHFRA
jgi:hypothetical protein